MGHFMKADLKIDNIYHINPEMLKNLGIKGILFDIDNTLEEYATKIKEYCLTNLCDEQTNTLKRSNKDDICDISLLGSVVPFDMLDKNEKLVKNTIERIEMNLRTYTKGYLRFENDSYMGGNNPWPIATLWMALYNMKMQNIFEKIGNVYVLDVFQEKVIQYS